MFHNETKTPPLLRPLVPLMNAAFQSQARKAVDGARQYLVNRSSGQGGNRT
jgi:hypothetical protein